MPFQRPTLPELTTRTEADLAGRLGLGALLRRGVLVVLARVLAGAAHLMHGHLDWLARQLFPDSAYSDSLDRWALTWGVQRKAATASKGTALFTGDDAATIPAGTRVRREDTVEFTTRSLATIVAGEASVALDADVAGVAGNTATGLELTLVSPLANIDSTATVEDPGLYGGADEETDAALRTRLLQRIQTPPQGGATSDYVGWALERPSVTRAWCLPAYLGTGSVGVTFTVDDDPAGPIPTQAQVDDVQAHIDALRPVTAVVLVFAPSEQALDPIIELTPNTLAVQQSVEIALLDLLRNEAVPGGTLLRSHINEAISTAAGEVDHVLVSPTDDVTPPSGTLLTLGTITWQ